MSDSGKKDSGKKFNALTAELTQKTAAAWALWHYHTLGITDGVHASTAAAEGTSSPTSMSIQPPMAPMTAPREPAPKLAKVVAHDVARDFPADGPLDGQLDGHTDTHLDVSLDVQNGMGLTPLNSMAPPLSEPQGHHQAKNSDSHLGHFCETSDLPPKMGHLSLAATTNIRAVQPERAHQPPPLMPESGPELCRDLAAPTIQNDPKGSHGLPENMPVLPNNWPEKEAALIQLANKIRAFRDLPISQTAENLVFADGNPHSAIMLVGEAPGAEEDRQGRPFVGASGKLLDAMLASIGLDRTRVYIANVVPWRPPFNRQPSAPEIRAFLPFLQKHIAIIQPRVIICVGGVAAKALLNLDQTLTETQGQLLAYTSPEQAEPIPAWTLYHPAYLMRAPGQKKVAWQQLLCIQAFLKQHKILESG